jgi:hypothetical protein
VASVPPDNGDADTRWLSLSGGEGFGFLVRRHTDEDSRAQYDHWAQSLEDALSYGDAYGVSRKDWHKPEHPWVSAPPPVGFKGD